MRRAGGVRWGDSSAETLLRAPRARPFAGGRLRPVLSRLQPLAKLGRNPSLRRAGIGFALFNAAEYGEWIAVLVYAYAQGGASASGLLAFAQLVPCVVLAPVMATFADRYQPGRVLVAGFAAQAVGMGLLAAALLADAPPVVVYALAVLAAPTFNMTRPTVNVVLAAGGALARRADGRERRHGLDRERRRGRRPARGIAHRRVRRCGSRRRAVRDPDAAGRLDRIPADPDVAPGGAVGRRLRPDRRAGRLSPPGARARDGDARRRAHLAGAVSGRDGRALRGARDQRARDGRVRGGPPQRRVRRRRPAGRRSPRSASSGGAGSRPRSSPQPRSWAVRWP